MDAVQLDLKRLTYVRETNTLVGELSDVQAATCQRDFLEPPSRVSVCNPRTGHTVTFAKAYIDGNGFGDIAGWYYTWTAQTGCIDAGRTHAMRLLLVND